ncbi:MAG TPA: hypothetical protein VGC68_05270 [Enterovirga sp.]
MMLRLLAGALVVGTIFVLSPERQRAPAPTLPGVEQTVAAIPGAARDAIAGQVARSLLSDGLERARQALPGAEPGKAGPRPAHTPPPRP